MIRYLLLLHLCLGAFYALYHWQLYRLPHLRLNRLYLLTVPLLCLLLPLLKLPVPAPFRLELQSLHDTYWEPIQGEVAQASLGTEADNYPIPSGGDLLLMVYALGALWSLMRHMANWIRAFRYLRRPGWVRIGKIYLARNIAYSCTFLGRIYLGQDFSDLPLRERLYLLRHEAVHARKGHSWDLLWLQLFRVVAWCNPCAQYLIRSVKNLHEFQADRAAAPDQTDFVPYTRLLLTLQQRAEHLPVAAFHSHPLTQRIMMLKQNQSPGKSRWSTYLLSLPLLCILLSISSFRMASLARNASLPVPLMQNMMSATEDPDHLPTLRPVAGAITSAYGMRMHPVLKVKKMHFGTDFQAPLGTPVMAAGSGTVLAIRHLPDTYGHILTIDHGNGYQSRYAQLSAIEVKVGEKVKQGETVALSGSSGMSTAPHLHFEILHEGKFVNPEKLWE